MCDAITGCVELHRKTLHGELEIRMGSYAHGEFRPGVCSSAFAQLERDLRSVELQETPWSEVVDFYYPVKNAPAVRSRVVYDAEQILLRTEHVSKTTLRSVIVSCGGDGTEVVRVAEAREAPVTPPASCLPTHVRIKQVKRFLDVRDGSVVWAYELSKTWSASSRSAVEHLQHVATPTFEVECELVDEGGHYMRGLSDASVSDSLLNKSRMFLGEESSCPVEVLNVFDVREKPTRKATRS